MPELSDDMYCSQQIMVPPMFPYLLRQYAKAAIRSQPTDLLRWSTAYFRCLSLNLPPPVKPRLEYPIPRDYDGITPGWLRALLHQIGGPAHVDFKTLWDRWIGSCLHHHTLIKILCLGAFDNPLAVPFLRFIALCSGFISENLTQTMILLCEVLTEEPEGGSAMIPLELFVDLYTYLSNINASKDQTILNRYFRDSLLDLLEKKKREPPARTAEAAIVEERVLTPVASTVLEEARAVEEKKEEVSCLDISEIVDVESEHSEIQSQISEVKPEEEIPLGVGSKESPVTQRSAPESQMSVPKPDGVSMEDIKSQTFVPISPLDVGSVDEEEEEKEPVVTETVDETLAIAEDINKYLNEMERKSAADEGDEPPKPQEEEAESVVKSESFEEEVVEEEVEEEEEKVELEEIFVEAIPGIGGIVPPELLAAVVEYMKKCAATQHGMVMPRNIRHYSCPPLEVLD